MSRENKIIISISGIVLILLLLIWLTYGLYLTNKWCKFLYRNNWRCKECVSTSKIRINIIKKCKLFYIKYKKIKFSNKKIKHTVDDFKTWLNGKKLVINYELQNINEETVSLPSIITDESTKNIEIGTSTKLSKTQIEYI